MISWHDLLYRQNTDEWIFALVEEICWQLFDAKQHI